MKTLFFIAALAAAVFLVMQTPAGQAWMQKIEPEQDIPTQTNTQVASLVETQMAVETQVTELVQQLNQQQQAQIRQLETRIAELENELIMGRVTEKQQQQNKKSIESIESGVVTLHAYKQQDTEVVTPPSKPIIEAATQAPEILAATSHHQMQRNRQARLQDIAEKMEMSSLQALVN
jgi:TolA-binding protein